MKMNMKVKGKKTTFKWPKSRFTYRDVTLWPEDFRKLVRIFRRLESFHDNAEIMHTRDYMELERIIMLFEKLLRRYDQKFKAHSTDYWFTKKKYKKLKENKSKSPRKKMSLKVIDIGQRITEKEVEKMINEGP